MATKAQILALGVQSGDIFAKASDTGNFYHIPAGGDGGDAVRIMDENDVGGASVQQTKPPGMARMVSVKATGQIDIYASSTNGYFAVRSWDGAVTVGLGSLSLVVPTSGAWSKSAPKEIYVWSCTSGNATQSGDLTFLEMSSSGLTSLDVSGLSSLGSLYLYDNSSLTSLDVSGLSSLTFLDLSYCGLTSFDGSGLSSLEYINISDNNLTSILLPEWSGTQPYTWTTYSVNLYGNSLSTDAVWLLLDSLPVASDQPYPINLNNNPCDDTVTAGPNLVAGATYSQAQVEALLTEKGYELQLSGGTLTM